MPSTTTTTSTPRSNGSAKRRLSLVPSGFGEGSGTVWILGEIDARTAPELRRQLCVLLEDRPPGQVELDLSRVGFLDAAGVRTLLEVSAWAAARGSELVVRAISPCAAAALTNAGYADVPAATPDFAHRPYARHVVHQRTHEVAAVTLLRDGG